MKNSTTTLSLALAALLGLALTATADQGAREISPSNSSRTGADLHPTGADRHPKGSATPEPFTMALVAGGGAVLYLASRRRRKD